MKIFIFLILFFGLCYSFKSDHFQYAELVDELPSAKILTKEGVSLLQMEDLPRVPQFAPPSPHFPPMGYGFSPYWPYGRFGPGTYLAPAPRHVFSKGSYRYPEYYNPVPLPPPMPTYLPDPPFVNTPQPSSSAS